MLTHVIHCRYLIVIINGTKNPHRSEVAKDICDSVLKTGLTPKALATYYSKEEQAVRLTDAYKKWEKKGGVWSVAASKVTYKTISIVHRD